MSFPGIPKDGLLDGDGENAGNGHDALLGLGIDLSHRRHDHSIRHRHNECNTLESTCLIRQHLLGNKPGNSKAGSLFSTAPGLAFCLQICGSGGRTRTYDTRIMIPCRSRF